jgi:hypothetical protein
MQVLPVFRFAFEMQSASVGRTIGRPDVENRFRTTDDLSQYHRNTTRVTLPNRYQCISRRWQRKKRKQPQIA